MIGKKTDKEENLFERNWSYLNDILAVGGTGPIRRAMGGMQAGQQRCGASGDPSKLGRHWSVPGCSNRRCQISRAPAGS